MSKRSLQQSDDINIDSNEPKTKKRRLTDTTVSDSELVLNNQHTNSNHSIEEELETQSDTDINETEALIIEEWFDSLKVLKYSINKLYETKEQYANEIKNRTNAISKIKSSDPLTDADYNENNELINKNKLWSHCMPVDILKIIFEFCIFNIERNSSILPLIKTCKSWGDIIINIHPEKHKKLFEWLWYGVISKRLSKTKLDWKHIVIIPKKYLALLYNINHYSMVEMSKQENLLYRQLVAIENGQDPNNVEKEMIFTADSNIPLWIQILHHCPKLYSIDLHGVLCKDIFVVLTDYGKQINCMSLEYVECDQKLMYYLDILGESHVEGDTLKELKSISVERGMNWFDLGLFAKYFKELESVQLQQMHVDGDVLLSLFENCVNLLSVEIFKGTSEEGDWYGAFKMLTERNKKIEYINIKNGEGFDDECCKLFMDESVCPNLKELYLCFTAASQEMIDELKAKRKDIQIEMEPMDW